MLDNDYDEPGFDAGPDDVTEDCICESCDAEGKVIDRDGEELCQECYEGACQAAADSRAEQRAERRAMACDLGTGPSDNWD